MITANIPENWRDLQACVAEILSQCGFNVDLERVIELGRGKAEIDVYAEEAHRGRLNRIICECKYWKAAVPQQIVHAFRTVTSDVGANASYIIALSGFQSGAHEAVQRTNLRLVTWKEFQDEFETTWLDTFFAPTITTELDALMTYTEPFAPAWFDKLTETEREAYVALAQEHVPLGVLAMRLSIYHQKLNPGDFPLLPIRGSKLETEIPNLPDSLLDAKGYADLSSDLLKLGTAAITQFRTYRDLALGRS